MRLFMQHGFDAAPDDVFAAATDLMAWPTHISSIRAVKVLAGDPVGEGTLMDLDRHSAGGGFMGCLMAPMYWLMKDTMKKMMAKDFEELACAMGEAH